MKIKKFHIFTCPPEFLKLPGAMLDFKLEPKNFISTIFHLFNHFLQVTYGILVDR